VHRPLDRVACHRLHRKAAPQSGTRRASLSYIPTALRLESPQASEPPLKLMLSSAALQPEFLPSGHCLHRPCDHTHPAGHTHRRIQQIQTQPASAASNTRAGRRTLAHVRPRTHARMASDVSPNATQSEFCLQTRTRPDPDQDDLDPYGSPSPEGTADIAARGRLWKAKRQKICRHN
jgi:hypothetical protein